MILTFAGQTVECDGRDLGFGGLFIFSKDPIPVRTDVHIDMPLRHDDDRIELDGKVVRNDTTVPGIAVVFTHMTDETAERLRRFLQESVPAIEHR